ncbi:hypothetical protein CDAR_422261 [Caerostris darwini]|uniref:Uncharacterized protein n=1 Tax=Caerostris darwini TaxID=1538125 RepID=A0AAV4WV79_9ARAC|nr:hypothetical protein CDAR_422261 [Caerostris darwini]
MGDHNSREKKKGNKNQENISRNEKQEKFREKPYSWDNPSRAMVRKNGMCLHHLKGIDESPRPICFGVDDALNLVKGREEKEEKTKNPTDTKASLPAFLPFY